MNRIYIYIYILANGSHSNTSIVPFSRYVRGNFCSVAIIIPFLKEVANNKFAKISNKAEKIMEARSFQLDFYYTCRERYVQKPRLLKLAIIIIFLL